MMRIGDFSKLSRVSVKTLRFYDEMDLLKPVKVDPFTSYRYYEYDQLLQLYRILALKDLGFSLEEIHRLLSDKLSAEEMRGMLKLRQAEIRQKVKVEAERLERVEIWLRQIEQEDNVSEYVVIIKKVDTIQVASLRDIVTTPPEQGRLWRELGKFLGQQHIRTSGDPCLTVYYDEEYKERDWDLEVCEPVSAPFLDTARVKCTTLPAVATMASTIHHGPFTTIDDAYQALMKWLDANGYRICGPAREVYIREADQSSAGASQSDQNTVTEIQFPVEKIS